MLEITTHMNCYNFFVVASGVVDEGTMKLYLLAQQEGVKCFVEVEFVTGRNLLTINFKVESGYEGLLGVFVKNMSLGRLFGEFIEKN